MSDPVAKEKLTAWQRWELPAFDAGAEELLPKPPTAAEIEQLHRQAHEEGYQTGYAAGAQQARDEEQKASEAGQKANEAEQKASEAEQKALAEAERLTEMIGALDTELQRVDEEVAQSLLDLALEIAQQVLRQSLAVRPELLLGVVRQAVAELPPFSQHAHLILHPIDAQLVRAKMSDPLEHGGWKIVEDEQMERGGCRVQTAHSRIDATLATRWKRALDSIGQDKSWLTS
jgi:flagellar assembly protein FliH